MTMATTLVKSVKGLPRRLFGTRNDRLLKTYRKYVGPINDLEAATRGDYDECFRKRVAAEAPDELPASATIDVGEIMDAMGGAG